MKKNLVRYIVLVVGLLLVITVDSFVNGQEPSFQSRIGATPDTRAKEVLDRHRPELLKQPGVTAVVPVPVAGKIYVHAVVFTDAKGEKPAVLPQHITTLPKQLEGVPIELVIEYALPPPNGVIILKPGGERVHADSCPMGHIETTEQGWRFCLDPRQPEPIPGVMNPPIAGIPFEEARAILNRHRAELRVLPGIKSIGLGRKGIVITTSNPAVVPKEIEGLPVEVQFLPENDRPVTNSHTVISLVRPIVGGDTIPSLSGSRATLAGAGFSGGMWLIFPAHALSSCTSPSPCADPVAQCRNRYLNSNMYQPPAYNAGLPVGPVVKWLPIMPFAFSTDAAAAWMDSDFNQGNSSLCTAPFLEQFGYWTGQEADTIPATVYVVSSNDPHVIPATVVQVDIDQTFVDYNCATPSVTHYQHQITYFSDLVNTTGRGFIDGDSGSAVVTASGKIVAMHQWSHTPLSVLWGTGGGTLAQYIRQGLGFSHWYGTSTMPNNGFGICQ